MGGSIWYTLLYIFLFLLLIAFLAWLFCGSSSCCSTGNKGGGDCGNKGGGDCGKKTSSSVCCKKSEFAAFYAIDGCNENDPNLVVDNPNPIPPEGKVVFAQDGESRGHSITRYQATTDQFVLKKKGKYKITLTTNIDGAGNLVLALQDEGSNVFVQQLTQQATTLVGPMTGVFIIETQKKNEILSVQVPSNATGPVQIFRCAGDITAQIPLYSWLIIERV